MNHKFCDMRLHLPGFVLREPLLNLPQQGEKEKETERERERARERAREREMT